MKVLLRILTSHAFRFVPSWNDPNARYAFRYVSWTRSSASAGFRVIRRAAVYSDDMYSIAWSANVAWSAMVAPEYSGTFRGPVRSGPATWGVERERDGARRRFVGDDGHRLDHGAPSHAPVGTRRRGGRRDH